MPKLARYVPPVFAFKGATPPATLWTLSAFIAIWELGRREIRACAALYGQWDTLVPRLYDRLLVEER